MCQVDEEYNGQLEHRVTPRVSKKCVKCKENTAVLIIRAGDAFCRGCFKEYFIHKFRAMLGKNRVIFPGEKVLLAVSGGPASSSMLSQVQEGLSRDAPKKLRFHPGIIYIDEGGASGQSMEERERAVAQLESVFRDTNYHYHIVHLEQVLSLPSSVLEAGSSATEKPQTGSSYKAAVDQFIQTKKNQHPDLSVENTQSHLSSLSMQEVQNGVTSPITPEHTQALQRLFASVRTLTAKEDLLHTLRQHLILHTARTQGYTKVMMGDSCSRLAIKLLSNISLGRGASLATDTGFSDPRYGDVVIVRPMRDYSSKEIAYYNRMFDIPSVFIPGLDTKVRASIQHLTESFVTKLQTDFPSTVRLVGLLYGRSSPDITGNNIACGHKPTVAGPDRTGKKCSSPTSRGFVSPGVMVGFAFIVERMSVTPTPVLWSGIDLEMEGPSWSGAVSHSIIGLSLLSLQAINAVRYREDLLLPHVVPFLQAHPDMTLQHDNGTSHTARSVCDFLQD
uniref:Cytoplasmic tRNA 2-thiolation protein 2 n=1 Tax=Hucho hucho TaxID=62062 RepID=A0A4W5JSZ9_9TELE